MTPTFKAMFVCLLTLLSYLTVDAQFWQTLDPVTKVQLDECREVCGNTYYDCKIGKCEAGDFGSEEGYGPCIDLCQETFYECVRDCSLKYTPTTTAAPLGTLPPAVFDAIRKMYSAQEISDFNSRLLHRQPQEQYIIDQTGADSSNQVVKNLHFFDKFTEAPHSFTGTRA